MITIAYITGRLEPRFDLFADSIAPQLKPTDQVVFVDNFAQFNPNRINEYRDMVDGRFDMLHIPPKPSIWLGAHRKARRAFYDTSGTRNTAIIVAEHNYIVFVDDLTAVYPGWRDFHQKAADRSWVFCGAYQSVVGLKVLPDGSIHHSKVGGVDSRMKHQLTNDPIRNYGSWLFGSNTGIPLECLLKVNGYDEFCARRGGEDCQLGVRLENAGFKERMYYDKNCMVAEDQWYHHAVANSTHLTLINKEYPLRRWKTDDDESRKQDKGCEIPEKMDLIERDHLYDAGGYLTLSKDCDIKAERELYRKTGTFRSVKNDTFTDYDGQPLGEM
tara:strand:+ start:339 stop:1325 length:987 start_codon:yes stop_codon:yes gene_type:complete